MAVVVPGTGLDSQGEIRARQVYKDPVEAGGPETSSPCSHLESKMTW
jgi:hypothetical protein